MLKKLDIANPVVTAENGLEALHILRSENATHIAGPFIVLLDLNMPVMGGFEFLDLVIADSNLDSVPIILLTTDDYSREIPAAHARRLVTIILKASLMARGGGRSLAQLIDTLDHSLRRSVSAADR